MKYFSAATIFLVFLAQESTSFSLRGGKKDNQEQDSGIFPTVPQPARSLGTFTDWVKGTAQDVSDAAKKGTQDVVDATKNGTQDAIDATKTGTQDVIDTTKTGAQDVADWTKKESGNVSGVVKKEECNICKDVYNELKDEGSEPACDAVCGVVVEAVGAGPEDVAADIVAAACVPLCAAIYDSATPSASSACKAATLC